MKRSPNAVSACRTQICHLIHFPIFTPLLLSVLTITQRRIIYHWKTLAMDCSKLFLVSLYLHSFSSYCPLQIRFYPKWLILKFLWKCVVQNKNVKTTWANRQRRHFGNKYEKILKNQIKSISYRAFSFSRLGKWPFPK